jgi:hypothetical protein
VSRLGLVRLDHGLRIAVGFVRDGPTSPDWY